MTLKSLFWGSSSPDLLSDESVDFLDEFSDTVFVSTAGFVAGLSLRLITFVSSSSPNTFGKACLHSTYTSDRLLEISGCWWGEIVTILSFIRCTKTSRTSVTAAYSVNVTNPNPRGSTTATNMRRLWAVHPQKRRGGGELLNLLLSRSTMIMQSWIVPNLEKYSDSYSTGTVRPGLSATYF